MEVRDDIMYYNNLCVQIICGLLVHGVRGFRVGKLCKFAHSRNKGKLREVHVNDNYVHSYVRTSSHIYIYTCGCVVDGTVARTAY